MTPQIKLTAARNKGSRVTVHLDDGRVLTGVVERSLTEQLMIRVNGERPAYFLPGDVVDVRPA